MASAISRTPAHGDVGRLLPIEFPLPGGSDGAAVTASRPSTAASAVVMNAANSPGTRSSLSRARSRMTSKASKLDAVCLMHRLSPSPDATAAVRAQAHRAVCVCDRRSRGLAHAEPDALCDLAEVVVGEAVAVAAELASEGALADLLAPRGSVLVDGARIVQQFRIWSPIAAAAMSGRIGGRADMQASRAVGCGSR